MGLIQDQVLKALSAALNTSVTCDDLDVSPLRGALTVINLRVAAAWGDEPLVTIARISARLSLTKALGGTIAVSEANIEGLRVHVARNMAGEWNFPKRRISFASPEPSPSSAKKQRTVEIDKALLVDSQIHVVHAFKDATTYELLASPILANLTKRAGGYDVTLVVDAVKRPDTGDTLGAAKVSGKIDGGTDLAKIADMAVSLAAQLDNRANAEVKSPNLAAGPYAFQADAEVDLATLKSAVPKTLLERVPSVSGTISLDAAGTFDRGTGLRLDNASIRVGAAEVSLQ